MLTLDDADGDAAAPRRKVHRLETRVEVLLAIVRLLLVLVRLRDARLDGERLPEGAAKEQVLGAIKRATGVLRLDTALRVVGLSPSRYHSWRQTQRLCRLDDRSSCPKTTPFQLTAAEVSTIHEMVLDDDYRHIPVSGLAILAQRMGRVFSSPTTWSKLIRERGWRRPKERIHPKSPGEGIRATRPNEYWHIDVTVIRLLNGTRVNLQAVIDNFSRRILAWRVTAAREPRQTRQLLLEAAKWLPADAPPPNVMVDAGTENLNSQVAALESSSGLFEKFLDVVVPGSTEMNTARGMSAALDA